MCSPRCLTRVCFRCPLLPTAHPRPTRPYKSFTIHLRAHDTVPVNIAQRKSMKRINSVVLIAGVVAVGTAGFVTTPRRSNLVVHEWGTFTGLQGSDGIPLKWNPLESSKLPGFVYNWAHPGLGRRPTGMLAL